ncbi:MAG: lysostaphin resistance A-like protein [Candidatus Odinarchaeota archaeon]
MVIYERDNKFSNFLMPALASVSGFLILLVLQLVVSIPAVMIASSITGLPEEEAEHLLNLLVLFGSQILGAIAVYFLLVPFFRVKQASNAPITRSAFIQTFYLICLTWGLIIAKNLISVPILEALNAETPVTGTEVLILPENMINPLNVLILLLPVTIGAPLFEELLYRRTLIPLLEDRGMSPFSAVVTSTLFFTFIHLPADLINGNITGTILHITSVVLLGFAVGVSYVLTRNVLYPMIIHGSLNGVSAILTIVQYDEDLLNIWLLFNYSIVLVGLIVAARMIWKYIRKDETEYSTTLTERSRVNIYPGFTGFCVISMGLVTLHTIFLVITPIFTILAVSPIGLLVLVAVILNMEYETEQD